MSALAFNLNGEPFDVPPATAAWRVRRVKPKGAPEVVYGRDGLPLFLPLDADIEDLRREAPAPADGRYRLDPVDDHNRSLPNAQSGYVCMHAVTRDREPEPAAPTASAVIQADTITQLVHALLESQKQHTELARMYVAQFPVLVNALSAVVRSAGDAGLPARVPFVVPVAPEVRVPEPTRGEREREHDEDDEDEDEGDQEAEVIEAASAPKWNWPRFATAALDKFGPAIDALVGQLPTLGAALGGRRAERPASEPTKPASTAPATDLAAHLSAIRAALPAEEVAAAMALVDELPMVEKLAYVQKVREMSVPDAVVYVRSELAKRARNSAHGAVGQEADEEAGPGIGMSDAEFDAHIAAICAAMTTDESKTVWEMFDELAEEHRLIWARKLCRMSVPEGVAFLRSQLAEALRCARARGVVDPRIVCPPNGAPASAARPSAPVRGAAPHASAPINPRRDGRPAAGSTARPESPPARSAAPTRGAPSAEAGMMPMSQAHIDAILRALTPAENAAMRAYLATLPPAERSAWLDALLALPVAEAVLAIRAQNIVDRAIAASTDDVIVAATAQPQKETNGAAKAVPVATASIASNASIGGAEVAPIDTAEIALIGAKEAVLHSSSTPTSTTPPASVDVAASTDDQPVLALVIDSPADVMPTAPAAASPTTQARSLGAAATTAPPTVENNPDAHLLAIELALTARERFLVHTTVAQMDSDARELLLDQLLSASVPEGAAILRAALQDQTTHASPVDVSPSAPVLAGAPEPNRLQRLDDLETFDTSEEVETEELGHAWELTGEELEEEEQLDGQPDHASANDGQALADDRAAAAMPTPASGAELPTLDPEAYRRFMAINAELTFPERLRVHELGARLSPAEVRAWIAALTPLPVPEAVAKVRAALAMADVPTAASGNAKNGSVS